MWYIFKKRNVYSNIFFSLASLENANFHTYSATPLEKKLRRRSLLYFIILTAINLEMFVLFTWGFFKTGQTDYAFFITQQDTLLLHYVGMAYHLTLVLLSSCKFKYIELNRIAASLRCSRVYEEQQLLKNVNLLKAIFKQMNEVVEMLNKVMGGQLALMPFICSTYILEICMNLRLTITTFMEKSLAFFLLKLQGGFIFFVSNSNFNVPR
ncbi:hypothetical protein ABEB36_003291 [Hypothenemus hampei]|uniref:Uncharacterized protein n=1 Tax=Hypothenemus hampei TaxID=57062 RepID=A0ABD1F8M6_HYPHA